MIIKSKTFSSFIDDNITAQVYQPLLPKYETVNIDPLLLKEISIPKISCF